MIPSRAYQDSSKLVEEHFKCKEDGMDRMTVEVGISKCV